MGWLVIGKVYWDFSNNYFCRTDGGQNAGIGEVYDVENNRAMNGNATTAVWIKENIGKTTLNTYYKPDDFKQNNGYPILNWEYEKLK